MADRKAPRPGYPAVGGPGRPDGAAGLRLEKVEVAYGDRVVLEGIDLEVRPGEFVGLIGPNACGKSTLLKTVSRVLRPVGGRVLLDGRDVWRELGLLETARSIAVVPQDFPTGFPFTVEETVLMGRTPFVSRLRGEQPSDLARAREAMQATGTGHLAGRPLAELAGGDRQRVIVAKALAQSPRLLLLDEPTSHLDINHQVEILDLLVRLNRGHGLTIVIVLHDLNLAAMYCGRLLLIGGGRIAAEGRPEEVLTPGNLERVYGSNVLVGRHAIYGCPQITLVSQLKAAPVAAGAVREEAWSDAPRDRVHVVGGGGSSAAIIESLAAAGYRLTAGPLNAGDSDLRAARALGVETVTAPPFSPITTDLLTAAGQAMGAADAVVVGPVPFGHGNVQVLEAVLTAIRGGVPVLLVDGPVVSGDDALVGRDFTGGRAERLLAELVGAGASRCADEREVLRWMADRSRERRVSVGGP